MRPDLLSAAGDPLLERVAEMIRESESRQAERLTASLATLDERSESRRRYDLARIGAGLAYLDGKNGQHLSRTTELMGYMLEASEKGANDEAAARGPRPAPGPRCARARPPSPSIPRACARSCGSSKSSSTGRLRR